MININSLTISMKLPSLNEVIDVNRTNRHQGARYKKEIEELIGWYIKQDLTKGCLKPTQKPCEIYFEWHESTKRRDVDNIQSSQKFVLDALVENKVLKNDSRRYVKQIYHTVVNDASDFVRVRIEEIKE